MIIQDYLKKRYVLIVEVRIDTITHFTFSFDSFVAAITRANIVS